MCGASPPRGETGNKGESHYLFDCRPLLLTCCIQNRCNVSEFSERHDIDFPVPVRYEVEVLHVSLETLEDLCDPRFYPGTDAYRASVQDAPRPFGVMSRIRSTETLEHVTLGEMGGQSFVAVARRPNRVIIKNLETGVQGDLTMLPCPGVPFNGVCIISLLFTEA